MNTLDKLRVIEKKKTIYNIHYCKAGVGFCFYTPPPNDKIRRSFLNYSHLTNASFNNIQIKNDWKNWLTVDKYYPTFSKAVTGEYKRLLKIKDKI